MSEIKRLEENLSYLDRFIADIKSIESSIQSSYAERSYEDACRIIFEKIRELSSQEISRLSVNSPESARVLQVFSNNVLKLVSLASKQERDRHKDNQIKLDLVSEIVATTSSSRDELSRQIKDEKERPTTEVPEPIISSPPPVRTTPSGKALRKNGHRPPQVRKVGERPK